MTAALFAILVFLVVVLLAVLWSVNPTSLKLSWRLKGGFSLEAEGSGRRAPPPKQLAEPPPEPLKMPPAVRATRQGRQLHRLQGQEALFDDGSNSA